MWDSAQPIPMGQAQGERMLAALETHGAVLRITRSRQAYQTMPYSIRGKTIILVVQQKTGRQAFQGVLPGLFLWQNPECFW